MITQKGKTWASPSQFRTTGHLTHTSPFSFVDLCLWFSILPLSFSWVFFVAPVRVRLHYPLLNLGQMVSIASWELTFLDHWTQSGEGKCWVQGAARLVAVWWQWSQVSRWAKKYNDKSRCPGWCLGVTEGLEWKGLMPLSTTLTLVANLAKPPAKF